MSYPNHYAPLSPSLKRAQIRAADREARIADVKLRSPQGPAQQPGSNQITNPSPILPLRTKDPEFAGASQRQFRGVANPQQGPTRSGATLDVYAPPADWRGKQGLAFPPPAGNQRPDNNGPKLIPMDVRGAIVPRATKWGTDAELAAGRQRSLDLYATRYTQPAADNQPTPDREALLDSVPSTRAAMEAARNQEIAGQQSQPPHGTEITSERGPTTAATESGRGRFPRVNAQPPGMASTAQTTQGSATRNSSAPGWQQPIVQKYGGIGKAGTPENDAYVAGYKAKKAAGEEFDPMALADEIMAKIAQAQPPTARTPTAQPGAGTAMPLSTEAELYADAAKNAPPPSTEADFFADAATQDAAPAVQAASPTSKKAGMDVYASNGTPSRVPYVEGQKPADTDAHTWVINHDKKGQKIEWIPQPKKSQARSILDSMKAVRKKHLGENAGKTSADLERELM